jgi:hypothetical protein
MPTVAMHVTNRLNLLAAEYSGCACRSLSAMDPSKVVNPDAATTINIKAKSKNASWVVRSELVAQAKPPE